MFIRVPFGGASKIEGEIHRICRNMSPFKKLSKRDDQLSSYGVVDVVDNVAFRHWLCHCLTLTRERILSKYSTVTEQWTSSYSRSESPSVAESAKKLRQTSPRSDIHDVTEQR